MAVKVDKLLEIMEQARPILERYRGFTVEEMLADIAVLCGAASVSQGTLGRSPRNEGAKAEKRPGPTGKRTRLQDVGAVVAQLESMDTGAMAPYLDEFLKADLEEIAARLNLKGVSSQTKSHIVGRIVRYYEDRRLPEKIAQRAPADDEAFLEEMRQKFRF